MSPEEPLTGVRLVVTRPADQASSLAAGLAEQGAEVLLLPMIAIANPADGGAALAGAATRLDQYDRIVVTSPNGAHRLLAACQGSDPTTWPPIAAIGPATAEPLLAVGAPVDLVPKQAVAESLLDVFPDPPGSNGQLLLIRAESAREVLPESLVASGWDVDVVVAYRNVEAEVEQRALAEARLADAVTFTAASAVARYHQLAGGSTPKDALCIGPISGAAARGLGFQVVEAEPHSVGGLIEAACHWAGS